MKFLLIFLFLLINPLDSISQQRRQQPTQKQRSAQQKQRSAQQKQRRKNSTPQKQRRKNSTPQKRRQKSNKKTASNSINSPYLELLESNFYQWEIYIPYPNDNRLAYSGIYYNPSNKTYAHATITEVSGSDYPSIITNLKKLIVKERSFTPNFQEQELYYLGDMNQTNRVYIYQTNTNKLYLKSFNLIEDLTYTDNGNVIFTNKEPVFPALNTLFEIQYTNKSEQIFNRVLTSKGQLRFLGSVDIDQLQKLKN